MFVWKKKYDAVTREMGRKIVERDDTLMVREATIGRLQRTSEDMLARNLELQARVIASDAKLEAAMASLAQIAAQETPTTNATVKRMARFAREGIGARNARDQQAAA
ncbi:hypothetical protein [Sphingobium sp.]|uniref:hypothetical protein n=1 Tax=Sphingobium sp. TaxID=1912891 RepID=UPI00257F4A26|nr:hypothetical protein [Sphingobium sp.]MBR2268751.1 hypothetical protein [Sphingobium sp.]